MMASELPEKEKTNRHENSNLKIFFDDNPWYWIEKDLLAYEKELQEWSADELSNKEQPRLAKISPQRIQKANEAGKPTPPVVVDYLIDVICGTVRHKKGASTNAVKKADFRCMIYFTYNEFCEKGRKRNKPDEISRSDYALKQTAEKHNCSIAVVKREIAAMR